MSPSSPLANSAARCDDPSSSPIKRLPVEPPGPVRRGRLANFQRAQVRRAAREAVIHRWNRDAGIYRFAFRIQSKIQVASVVDGMTLCWIGSNQLLKNVEIDFDAVRLLPS